MWPTRTGRNAPDDKSSVMLPFLTRHDEKTTELGVVTRELVWGVLRYPRTRSQNARVNRNQQSLNRHKYTTGQNSSALSRAQELSSTTCAALLFAILAGWAAIIFTEHCLRIVEDGYLTMIMLPLLKVVALVTAIVWRLNKFTVKYTCCRNFRVRTHKRRRKFWKKNSVAGLRHHVRLPFRKRVIVNSSSMRRTS